MRHEILQQILRVGLLPNAYRDDFDEMKGVVEATLRGGCPAFEFVNRGPGAVRLFEALATHFRADHSDLLLGAGTVIEAGTAAQYINAGAQFIVGPSFDRDVASLCGRRGVPYIPGVATATEVSDALAAGADVLKVFPARELGGPTFLRAILGPFPDTPLMPSGGVSTEPGQLRAYIDAGAVCVSIGGALFAAQTIGQRDWESIEAGVSLTVRAIADARVSPSR
jgi:2-dehydro-3-deoxyphosphogluconate aldolase / (4S)-4-hydroxy-2-oxoglutarate aldolase